ncbi:MAG: DUF389 domain-containing protein [Candidatus Solibacter sp.]
MTSLRGRIEHLLKIAPDSKPGVYLQVFNASELASLNYGLELLFSAGIATLGLVLNSPAVVIGAMLISPLMGPILGAGLALASADLYLGIKSLLSILIGVATSILFSAALVWTLPFQTPTSEILARTQPNLLDLGVALFSGLAGSVVVCRKGEGGGVTALPGVAIAVALMPPLCTVGFGVGSGFAWPIISGAGLLFLTNLAAIVASAFVVFYVVRMDSPDVRATINSLVLEGASRDRLYIFLQRTKFSGALGHIGKLRWRIVMLLAVLAMLFVPLSKSLLQVRDETRSRAAVREAIRLLGPPDAFVTQQIDITPAEIIVRLFASTPIPKAKIAEAEKVLLRRTGKEVSLVVRKVASEEELALLRQQLKAPTRVAPPLQDLDSIRAEVMARLAGPIKETWPAEAGELLGYEVGFTTDGMLLKIQYRSNTTLDPVAQEILTRAWKTQFKVDKLQLEPQREEPEPAQQIRGKQPPPVRKM